jgi:hypothetical protein
MWRAFRSWVPMRATCIPFRRKAPSSAIMNWLPPPYGGGLNSFHNAKVRDFFLPTRRTISA